MTSTSNAAAHATPEAAAHQPTAAEPAAWRVAREKKRAQRAALIKDAWKLTPEQLSTVPQIGIPEFLDKCGWFTPKEIELVNKSAVDIVGMIAKGELTCVEVTETICHRAAVVHQITNCLTEIMFEQALARLV